MKYYWADLEELTECGCSDQTLWTAPFRARVSCWMGLAYECFFLSWCSDKACITFHTVTFIMWQGVSCSLCCVFTETREQKNTMLCNDTHVCHEPFSPVRLVSWRQCGNYSLVGMRNINFQVQIPLGRHYVLFFEKEIWNCTFLAVT